jgi:uncharacterized protein with FMN-binding domain
MRKLLLSVCVIAASAAYVAKTAMTQEAGVQGLLDRISFRSSPPAPPPLDLGDPLAPAGALATSDVLPPLTFAPPADLGPLRPDTPPPTAAPPSQVALAAPPSLVAPQIAAGQSPSPEAPQTAAAGTAVIPPLPRLAPRLPTQSPPTQPPTAQPPQVALADPKPAPQLAPGPQPAPSVTPPPAGKYRDGAFTGSLNDAYFGMVQVRAHVTGGKLTNVDVLTYPADRRTSRSINGYALPLLEREVVVAQNAHVHMISGATLTTSAYLKSLDAALRQAQ